MENSLIIIISLIMIIIGVIGSVLPVLPGPPLAWGGLVIFKYSEQGTYNWWLLIICLVFVLAVVLMDYLLPAYGSKKMGGSKYGMIGTTIGLILGVIFSPFGFVSIIIMPFLGAFIGEFIFHKNDKKNALKAAFGSFLGFLVSTGFSLIVSLSFFGIFVYYMIKSS